MSALRPRLRRFWVEVLLDDGETYGFAAEAHDEMTAAHQAMDSATERGLKPVCMAEMSDNDTGELLCADRDYLAAKENGEKLIRKPLSSRPVGRADRTLADGRTKCDNGEVLDRPRYHDDERSPHDLGPGWWQRGPWG